jgi:hypothetical protein
MTPDEQRQFIARLNDRGIDTTPFQTLMDKSISTVKPQAPPPAFVYKPRYGSAQNSETIDSLFAPLPVADSNGRVWMYVDHQLKPVSVRLGITDGTYTELLTSGISEGTEVVTNITGLSASRTSAAGSGNPLMPQPQRGGGPGPGRGR